VELLDGRAAVLDATGHHPYARFATASATGIIGLRHGRSQVWYGSGPLGRLGHGLGDPDEVDLLLAAAAEPEADWVNLPRRPVDRLPPGYELREDWDLRWLVGPVPPTPGMDRVVAVDHADAVNRLLDVAMPDSMLRPGHPMAHGWSGVWAGTELVACAADRSARPPDASAGGVGVIGAVAVHPDHRRQGLGAAVSAALTVELRRRYGLVTLGVVDGNDAANRVYRRLGYTGVAHITSMRVCQGR
jgi:GNAT superfamily N-acetyltransferase